MNEHMVRLLYVGLKQDIGFDSADYYRLKEQIEKLDGVRHCRELRSIGPNDLIHRMTFLAEIRQRIVDSCGRAGINAALSCQVIDEMAEELEKRLNPKRCPACGTTNPERFQDYIHDDRCIQCIFMNKGLPK